MIAFHGDHKIKAKYVARLQAHAKADQIVQGHYWENGKGCAVGCTIHGSEHDRYETELGIPQLLARLEDRIFEGLSNGEAQKFPLRFLESIRAGADLSLVWPKFAHWLLMDAKAGVLQFARTERTKDAINAVGGLYARAARGEAVAQQEWESARRSAAAAAAAAAADAATADAATAYAAYAADAADAADAATAYAAYAAYAAATAYGRRKHYKLMADKLIELLLGAPIVSEQAAA